MWRDCYLLGVDAIDNQHIEMFNIIDGLIKDIDIDFEGCKKENYKNAVKFMREFSKSHFLYEEKYQNSINYSGIEEHKKEHIKFMNALDEHEKSLIESDYNISDVKRFAGMLTSWLIYHVMGTDQKMAGKNIELEQSCCDDLNDCFYYAIENTFKIMFNSEITDKIKLNIEKDGVLGDIFVSVGIIGDLRGNVVFGYSSDFALNIFKSMTMMDKNEIDDMVCSAMAEISNIIIGNSTIKLSDLNYICDISTPLVTVSNYNADFMNLFQLRAVKLDTNFGNVSYCIAI